jgi:hypothetical protein
MADINKINLREYSRVDAQIAIEVRVVPPPERQNIKCFISGDIALPEFQIPAAVNDPALADWLAMLNAKLDAIASIISQQGEKKSQICHKKVNISGGGLSFDSAEKFEIGDMLEIKMVLPVNISSTLYVYGEVVDVRAQDDHFQTAVKFITIDDEIREQIVQFVFKTQRDMLRHKKG